MAVLDTAIFCTIAKKKMPASSAGMMRSREWEFKLPSKPVVP